jgi:hypothetical protein
LVLAELSPLRADGEVPATGRRTSRRPQARWQDRQAVDGQPVRRGDVQFPDDPTRDQLFDHRRFESDHALGQYQIAEGHGWDACNKDAACWADGGAAEQTTEPRPTPPATVRASVSGNGANGPRRPGGAGPAVGRWVMTRERVAGDTHVEPATWPDGADGDGGRGR